MIYLYKKYKAILKRSKLVKMKTNSTKENNITRKEALKKIGDYGKYTALTALGTYLILNPKKSQAASPEAPGDGF